MIQVREYARLTTDSQMLPSLDCAVVSRATLDWLQELTASWKGSEPITLIDSQRSLKLGSYVGFLQSPGGESIEILPKTGLGLEKSDSARRILQDMLMTAMGIKPRVADAAKLMRMRQPLHEWIFSQFLSELQKLVTRGLRFDYQRTDEESRFIRGQLRVVQQQRQSAGKQHFFHISHDIYSPERVENCLLKTALDYVLSVCRSSENWRLANELSHRMADIPTLSDPLNQIRNWKSNKLMQAYDTVRPWSDLILEKLNPNFQQGVHRGISLLFPMEQLFEKYVESSLHKQLPKDCLLKSQASSQYLLRHTPENSEQSMKLFQLKPDLLLKTSMGNQVLDTKWKLIDQFAYQSNDKYGISQTDLYQLFAYGHKYQGGRGHMMLIYPKHQQFKAALPPFYFSDEMAIWAVPFCLETRSLVSGQWTKHFHIHKQV
ncbi:restriction endonuclease [Photobacterium aquimaris]|uniref:Restriction endonuclease n=1 Tax=Photobacterium aquimaris TaxID=512643 RepID=A0A2T3IET2_9GAMM|nr:McrC family protein [Photobacterium aquimaris]OBU20004.1 restriction endonuclease [Photobacterium aquimaris]PSU22780.1 restriction endonuclease [Photobacterium aquimaris]